MFIADLHTHSHYAKATSLSLNLETMYQWAQIKGIHLLSTGDFTHPGWLSELKDKLISDGSGFFSLRDLPRDEALPGIKPQSIGTKFCLSTEVSSVYTYQNKKRKIHNLIYAPDFETAERINVKLSQYADLSLDGRPEVPLSSRDVLEIVLQASPRAHLVPAHAWTPWYSLFGSKGGYDSVIECFRDLAPHIFAIETGLSSDPFMNRRCSMLDNITMMSNSDAHSASKLGREANIFTTAFEYDAMFTAIKNRNGFSGTLEFYSEEGKYSYDGHSKCKICFSPAETREHKEICPVCNQQLLIGAFSRVDMLADQKNSKVAQDVCHNIVPLIEILSEIHGASPASKKVLQKYVTAINEFGNELTLLHETPIETIHRFSPVLATGIDRMRKGQVIKKAGYDGVYGSISVLEKKEDLQMQLF